MTGIRRIITLNARIILLCLGAMLVTGCHSAFVQATVTNATGKPVEIFEVDYPSASFGSSQLQAGATFHYRFKVLGEGQSKISWTDAAEHDHVSKGPTFHEGQEGSLVITIGPDTAVWTADVHDTH